MPASACRRAPTSRSPTLAYDNRARRAGHAVLLRARLHARRPRLRPRRGRARRRRARRRAPAAASACPRSSSTTCAPRWRPPPPRFHGDPTARADDVGDHRHQRQDDDGLPRARAARGRRAARPACSAPSTVDRRRRASARWCARRPRRSTSSATFADDARRRRRARASMEVSSHALELHRADAIHWAAAIFTNLTQDHLDFHADDGGLLPAKRRLFDAGPRVAVVNVDDPYGARLAARASRTRSRFGVDAPDAAAARDRRRGRRDRLDASRVDGLALSAPPLPGRFNVLNALGAVAAARALGVGRRHDRARRCRRPAACPAASSRSTRARTSPSSSTTPTRPTRSRTCCAPRARSPQRPRDRRLRRRRRPRPRQAPADGRVAAPSSPTSSIVTSDNPRSEDPEAIIAEIARGHRRRRRASRRSSTAARRSSARSRWPQAGRRRRDRRQGPRAGPGVRGRPQDARSTTSPSPARRCVRDWSR